MHAKLDPFVLRHIRILFRHAALDFAGTSHGIYDAPELNESAVPGILDDTSVVIFTMTKAIALLRR